MFDVTWVDENEIDNMERYEDENEARTRYQELVESRRCTWIQLVYVIANWSEND